MGKANFFLGTMPFSPLASTKKHRKNEFTTHFEQKFTTGSYGVGFDMLDVPGKLVNYLVHLPN